MFIIFYDETYLIISLGKTKQIYTMPSLKIPIWKLCGTHCLIESRHCLYNISSWVWYCMFIPSYLELWHCIYHILLAAGAGGSGPRENTVVVTSWEDGGYAERERGGRIHKRKKRKQQLSWKKHQHCLYTPHCLGCCHCLHCFHCFHCIHCFHWFHCLLLLQCLDRGIYSYIGWLFNCSSPKSCKCQFI